MSISKPYIKANDFIGFATYAIDSNQSKTIKKNKVR